MRKNIRLLLCLMVFSTLIGCDPTDPDQGTDQPDPPPAPPAPVVSLTFSGDDIVCQPMSTYCNLFAPYQKTTTINLIGLDVNGQPTKLDPSLIVWDNDGPIALTLSGSGSTVTATANHDYFTGGYKPPREQVLNIKVRYGDLEKWLPTACVVNGAGVWDVHLNDGRRIDVTFTQRGRTLTYLTLSGDIDEDQLKLEQAGHSLEGTLSSRDDASGTYDLPGLGRGSFRAQRR